MEACTVKKSLIVITIALMLLMPTVLADEIQFRNIPWYSSIPEVQATFEDGIFIDGVEDYELPLVAELEADYSNFGQITRIIPGWVGYSPLGILDYKVAGHLADDLYVFCYDGKENGTLLKDIDSSHMYLAVYIFKDDGSEETYSDFQTKLSSLYGQFEETSDDDTTYINHKSVWRGDNETAAVLTLRGQKNADGRPESLIVYLTYSIAGADDLIRETAPDDGPVDPADRNGL